MLFFLSYHGNDFRQVLFCSRLNGFEVFMVFWIHSQKQSPGDQEGSASWPVTPSFPLLWQDRVFFFLFYFIVSEIERKQPGVLLLFSADIPRGRGWTRPGLASAWSSLPGQRGNRDGWIHARHVYGAGGRSGNDAEPVPWHCHFPFTGRGWRKAGVEAL